MMSRVGPSPPNGLNRCSAAVRIPFSCIQRKWTSTLCWSYDEKRCARRPSPSAGKFVPNVLAYSRVSGHDTIAEFEIDGGWSAWRAQCHQASIGAPSPRQANQPW